MSTIAMNHVADLAGLMPLEKLLLWQIARFHNHHTDQCNPSPERLASLTGLTAHQVRRLVPMLVQKGHIRMSRAGFSFPSLIPQEGSPVPINWWPSEATVAHFAAAYPAHHFDMEEAVNDFIRFATERSLKYPPDKIDAAFRRNLEALLDARGPGPIQIGRKPDGAEPRSIGALLSGGR